MEMLAKNDKDKSKNPPEPSPTGRPPSPPGLPIDEHILWLILLAVLLGFYVIYKYKQNEKPIA
ncbi:hypothetical protein FUMI01_06430 [Flavobacterium sp. UMI-01]|nr:hypothetical protein FUMI01_06430 [Flavobacterium sp. UMI-01]